MKKQCSACGEYKIANNKNFHKSENHKYGLHPYCKICQKSKDQKRYKKNSNEIKERVKQRRRDYPEKLKEEGQKYYRKNKTKLLKKSIEYRQRPERKKRMREIHQYRIKNDILYKLRHILRSRISKAFIRKTEKSRDILGCSIEEVRKHLENQFTEKMSWNNHGSSWEIDHIIPLASARDQKKLRKLCHYSNLQPLESSKNREKGARLDWKNN
jgi:hypothetical protein